jgi:Spy/CpxP family protein refolding chaperone
MMWNRARLWTIATVATVVTAVALPAVAGQRSDAPRGPRGPRGHFRQVLTQEQREQIRPWIQAEREASKPLADLRKQLRDAVLADAPDQGKIASLQSQVEPLQTEALTRRIALAQRIASLLTPEQRQELRNSRMLPPFLDPVGHGGPGYGPDGRGPHAKPGAAAPGAGR